MPTSDAEVAIAAAEAGAAVVGSRFGTSLSRFDKSATDLAADVDIASEQAVLGVLSDRRPADARYGEESGGSNDGSSGRNWLIDPLCGTVNFTAQTPMVAVNVALRDRAASRWRRSPIHSRPRCSGLTGTPPLYAAAAKTGRYADRGLAVGEREP